MIKKLKIGADVYTIETKDINEFGYIDSKRKKIYIAKGITPTERAATLLHESVHGIVAQYGLSQHYTHEAEEILVRVLEAGITAFFVDNKQFTKELIKAFES